MFTPFLCHPGSVSLPEGHLGQPKRPQSISRPYHLGVNIALCRKQGLLWAGRGHYVDTALCMERCSG